MKHWVLILAMSLWCRTAAADPCGMVPPIWTGQGPAITRVGDQMTYAFFRDGIESFVIKPGFSGKVDNFGMLIPFPSPPAIRKMPDDIFPHLQAAIDPPEVVLDLNQAMLEAESAAPMSEAMDDGATKSLGYNEVRVLRQEAVGMYQVAVLESGSASALKRWMDQNGYRYPKGMDRPVNGYVKARWAFVAVKTKVGSKPQVTPRPGMRKVSPTLPSGSSFDGQVQAMGFRFHTDTPVVPMRLSAFNEGRLRNIVYFLGPNPVRIEQIDAGLIKRQVEGEDLFENVSQPLGIRLVGQGSISLDAYRSVENLRSAEPHNRHARDLFASDLLAVKRRRLSLQVEEREKVLLRIGEALNLRGPKIDQLHQEALDTERKQAFGDALGSLEDMTLTVVDGDFPRKTLADENLTFRRHRMRSRHNNRLRYDARRKGPGTSRPGKVVTRWKKPKEKTPYTYHEVYLAW